MRDCDHQIPARGALPTHIGGINLVQHLPHTHATSHTPMTLTLTSCPLLLTRNRLHSPSTPYRPHVQTTITTPTRHETTLHDTHEKLPGECAYVRRIARAFGRLCALLHGLDSHAHDDPTQRIGGEKKHIPKPTRWSVSVLCIRRSLGLLSLGILPWFPWSCFSASVFSLGLLSRSLLWVYRSLFSLKCSTTKEGERR